MCTVPSQDEFSAEGLGLTPSLLSADFHKAVDAAAALRIDQMADVKNVLDYFRWINWLSLALHALRRPIPSPSIRMLVDAATPLFCAEDKILRPLQALIGRASAWKHKARKLVHSSSLVSARQLQELEGPSAAEGVPHRWVDAGRLASLVLESATLPVLSRLKDQLRNALEASQNQQAAAAMDGQFMVTSGSSSTDTAAVGAATAGSAFAAADATAAGIGAGGGLASGSGPVMAVALVPPPKRGPKSSAAPPGLT